MAIALCSRTAAPPTMTASTNALNRGDCVSSRSASGCGTIARASRRSSCGIGAHAARGVRPRRFNDQSIHPSVTFPEGAPIGRKDRPHRLIAAFFPLTKCAAQHAFARRGQFPQHTVPATVRVDGARFETEYATRTEHGVEEHSIEEQPRAARKKARPPVRFTEDEAPFGRREVALDRPELDDAGRSRLLRRDDAEAGVQPAPSLRPRPADEATKVLHGRRTRRDVPKDARVVQVRKQRWRVLQSKLAQNHAAVVQQRQASTPLTAASDGRSGIGYVLMYRHVGSSTWR